MSQKMGIREKINSTKIGAVVGISTLGAAIAISAIYLWPSGPHINYRMAFYSDDDGRTFFEDSLYKFPPFDHDGKTAVGAVVYVDAHNDKFVGYLTRYTAETKRQLQKIYDDTSAHGSATDVQRAVLDYLHSPPVAGSGSEVKLPGPGNPWMPRGQMMNPPIKMPDGGDVGSMVLP
jgi:hypothetical protein